MRVDDFNERLRFSSTRRVDEAVATIAKSRIPGAVSVTRASVAEDRTGCDYFVSRPLGADMAVDVKVRDVDYAARGQDDLALEVWAVVPTDTHAGKVGWTRDDRKATDWVVWLWLDTGRFHILPFPTLCAAFRRYWPEWVKVYRTARNGTSVGYGADAAAWQGEVVFVPRAVLDDTVMRWTNGTVPAWSPP